MTDGKDGASTDSMSQDESTIVDVEAYRWRRDTLEYRMKIMHQRVDVNSVPFAARPAIQLTPEDISFFPMGKKKSSGSSIRSPKMWRPSS